MQRTEPASVGAEIKDVIRTNMNSPDSGDPKVHDKLHQQDSPEIGPIIQDGQSSSVGLGNNCAITPVKNRPELKKQTKSGLLPDNSESNEKSEDFSEKHHAAILFKKHIDFGQTNQHGVEKSAELPGHKGSIDVVNHNSSLKSRSPTVILQRGTSPGVCRVKPYASLDMPVSSPPPVLQKVCWSSLNSGVLEMEGSEDVAVDSLQSNHPSNESTCELTNPETKCSANITPAYSISTNWKRLKEEYNANNIAQSPKRSCAEDVVKNSGIKAGKGLEKNKRSITVVPEPSGITQPSLSSKVIAQRKNSNVFTANPSLEMEERQFQHDVVDGKLGIMKESDIPYKSKCPQEIVGAVADVSPLDPQTNLQVQNDNLDNNSNSDVVDVDQNDGCPSVEQNFDAAAHFSQIIAAYSVKRGWKKYIDYVTNSESRIFSRFKVGFMVCAIGIVGLVVCITVGVHSAPGTCKQLLTIGTIIGGAITAVGGIWIMVAQQTHLTKAKVGAVVAGLIGIGGLITTTMDQIKDWCPETDMSAPINTVGLAFNLASGKMSLTYMSLPRACEGSVADRNRRTGQILVAGGYNKVDGTLDNAFLLDDANKSHRPVANMARARNMAAGGWIGNDTFIMCGGMEAPIFTKTSYEQGYFSSSCEGYTLGQGQWSELASMRRRVAGTGYVIVNNTSLYIFGGWNGTVTDYADMYSFPSNSWSTLPSLPSHRNLPAAVIYNQSILICGGYFWGPLFDCLMFNPTTLTYDTNVPPMLYPRYGFSLVPLPTGEILAVGGSADNQNTHVNHVELFDGQRWQQVGKLANGISYAKAFIIATDRSGFK